MFLKNWESILESLSVENSESQWDCCINCCTTAERFDQTHTACVSDGHSCLLNYLQEAER